MWPLIGRRGDLETVAGAIRRTGSAGAVVTGPAGVGKTRLLDECVRLAEDAGYTTFRAVGSRVPSELPLGALLHLLPPDVGDDSSELALVQAARRGLRERAAGRPALLCIDDAHLLDPSSLALVQQLALAREATVVLTVREPDPVPEPISQLWRDGHAARVALAPLTVEQVDALLHRSLGAPVARATLHQITRLADGNALYLRELVTGAIDDGTLVLEDGSWRSTTSPVPSLRLRELVAGRLGTLGRADRTALELLALAGHLGAADLRVLAPDADLVGLEERGLLQVTADRRRVALTSAHPLHAEVLVADLGMLRANELRLRLADHLEGHGARRRDDPVRIAGWRLDAGAAAGDTILLRAARIARSAHDYEGTVRLATAAREVASGGAAAAHLEGDARYLLGDTTGAHATLREASAEATAGEDIVGIALSWADVRFWGLGDGAGAVEVLETAAARVPAAAPLLAAKRASLTVFEGRPSEALVALSAIPTQASERADVQMEMAAGLAHALAGRASVATVAADAAVEGSAVLRGPAGLIHPVAHRATVALATLHTGRVEDATAVATAAIDQAAGDRLPFVTTWLALLLARTHSWAGDLDRAERWAADAVRAGTAAGQPALTRWARGLAATVAVWRGDHAAARASLAAADAIDPGSAAVFEIDVVRARAWLAGSEGRLEEAATDLEGVAAAALAAGASGLALGPASDLIRLGRPERALPLLTRAIADVEGELAPLLSDQARATAAADDAALEQVAGRFEELGCLLLAAEAWATVANLTAGRSSRQAAAASARVAMLRARCGGANTPALVTGPAATPLTPREREIALLVAGGLPSKEVAERLVVSRRTVDNHLQRVFAKLGISRRADLPRALGLEEAGGVSGE